MNQTLCNNTFLHVINLIHIIFIIILFNLVDIENNDEWQFGSMESAIIIASPFCVTCLIVVVILTFWQRKKKSTRYRKDIEGSVACSEPLILPPGQSLKDLLEHSTSGSGSG